MNRDLYVGVGGAGARVVARLEEMIRESGANGPKRASSRPAQFLVVRLECSEQVPPRLQRVDLPLEDVEVALANLDRSAAGAPEWREVLAWFPDRSRYVVSVSEGLHIGHNRVLGRLAFTVHRDRIERALRTAVSRTGRKSGGPCTGLRVSIVCAAGDGLGSGALVDLAKLCREVSRDAQIELCLLWPQESLNGGAEDQHLASNAYACLKELCFLKTNLNYPGNGHSGSGLGARVTLLYSPEPSRGNREVEELACRLFQARLSPSICAKAEQLRSHFEKRPFTDKTPKLPRGWCHTARAAKVDAMMLEAALVDISLLIVSYFRSWIELTERRRNSRKTTEKLTSDLEKSTNELANKIRTRLRRVLRVKARVRGRRGFWYKLWPWPGAKRIEEIKDCLISGLSLLTKEEQRQASKIVTVLLEEFGKEQNLLVRRVAYQQIEEFLAKHAEEMREVQIARKLLDQTEELTAARAENLELKWHQRLFSRSQINDFFQTRLQEVVIAFVRSESLQTCLEHHVELYLVTSALELAKKQLLELNESISSIVEHFEETTSQGDLAPELEESVRIRLDQLISYELSEVAAIFHAQADERARQKAFDYLLQLVHQDEDIRRMRFRAEPDGSYFRHLKEALAECQSIRNGDGPRTDPRFCFGLIETPHQVLSALRENGMLVEVEQAAEQRLATPCEILEGTGDITWVYYESLFHQPEELLPLDGYRRIFSEQEHPETFFIDRRLVELEEFRSLWADTGNPKPVVCGNSDCAFDISTRPRTERTCRGCGRPIRSRCGDAECPEDRLHERPDALGLSCPTCGGFNHAAHWACRKHGKREVFMSWHKGSCVVCVEEHQKDPVRYPLSEVGLRPDRLSQLRCPCCAERAKADPTYIPFTIPHSLAPFVRDGVNGHNWDDFLRLAREHGLPEDFRCPRCRTLLIPVHHRTERNKEDSTDPDQPVQ